MRKGKIEVENISGGEVTSAPLLATPQKYSRLLQNFYINSEGHIKKIPGWSPASQYIENIRILSGIDFKKSDGTSIKLVSGRYTSTSPSYNSVFSDPTSHFITHTGTGLSDITFPGTFVGASDKTYSVKCTYRSYNPAVPDSFEYRINSGAWISISRGYYEGESIVWYPADHQYDLGDGIFVVLGAFIGHTIGDTWAISYKTSYLNDLSTGATFSGTGTSVFEIEIDSEGAPDTFKWRKDSGAYTSGVAITGASQELSDGVAITFAATTGHSYSSKWSITYSSTGSTYGALYRLDNGLLSVVKNNFASVLPLYMAQMGDIIIASNNVDRPIAYDGTTVKNLNLPFGNSVVFSGVGLNDFTPAIVFTYESATYEVEIDGVAIAIPTITHTGTGGKNDLTVPSPNYSGAAATANFDVNIDAVGAGPDTLKYNVNGGFFVTGQEVISTGLGLNIGDMSIKAASIIGNANDDVYELKIVNVVKVFHDAAPDYYTYTPQLKWRKNGGAWSETIDIKEGVFTALDEHYSVTVPVGKTDENITVDNVYSFQIDGATSPDTFQWRKDSETYTTGVAIASGDMTLKEGINVNFKYFTGHSTGALGDTWTFDVARDTVKYSKDGTSVATGEVITGALQTIQAGIQFKFNAINGHTLGDKWTMPVDQSIRFSKLYPYKNRLWAISSDKLTVYYSSLFVPTDFTGEGSGYIDFRYVIPQGDELVDIGSLMNYIVFFFKNHIVIYSGSDPTAEGDFVIYQNIDGTGLVAPNTILNVGSDIYFLTNKGVKGLKQLISAGSLNIDNVSKSIDIDVIAAIDANTSGVYSSAHYATLGLLLFQIGDVMFVYNYRQNAWSRVVVPTTDNVSKILSMFESSDGFVYMGGYDYLMEFDPTPDTYNFNGVAPYYRWTSSLVKTTTSDSMYFTELAIRLASSKAATLTLKSRSVGFDTQVEDQSAFNEQIIDVSAITNNDAILNFVRTPLYGAGKFIQFDFTENPNYDTNDDVEIVGLEVEGELGIL